MSKKRAFFTQLVRHLVQIAAFILLPGLFIIVFSSIRDIVNTCIRGDFSFGGLFSQIILVLAIFIINVLMGRLFCGYMCSFGMFQELLFFIAERRKGSKIHIGERADRILKYLKYFVLALIVIFVWILGFQIDDALSPGGVFGVLVSGNFAAIPAVIPTLGFVLLIGTAVGSLFIEHFFCRYLCPLGALFAITSRLKMYKIKRNVQTCTYCGLCTKKCGMGINIPKKNAVVSGECIQCMECLPA